METTGTNLFLALFDLLFRDLLIVVVLAAVIVPLYFTRTAAIAVVRRNFKGYFSNPTGYVFLCVFVLLTSFAAFWPHQFFNANLANLNQLNQFLPLIMLIYIPAITMSIWSEERREKTDELLLTLPAHDFDIVIGKFLAAALIFTVSLLFSQISNFLVLASLARTPATYIVDLDTGLLTTNYFGYWLIGLSMLSLGMVASFLTRNATIAFVFGLAFNIPLVAAASADVIAQSSQIAQIISRWGIYSQFDDFQRGVLSLSSTMYFCMIISIGLYLCMVLIGKRHWSGGKDGASLWWHYLIRTVALVVAMLSLTIVFDQRDLVRFDTTRGKVSSLSDDSRKLIADLDPEHPVYIEAFISSEVTKEYVKTRYDLISMLKEFGSHEDIHLTILDTLEPFNEAVATAEENHGIPLLTVPAASGSQQIIMGAVFRSGLQKVVVPFFEYGIPVEYELARSIATVAKGKRKTIGVIDTDANIMGGFSFAGGQPNRIPQQAIVTELQKQYKMENVDASQEISVDDYDMLFIAQPSSLEEEPLTNVIRALQAGIPAVVFEDPRPETMQVPGTGQPRPPAGGGMMGMGGQPQPKCNLARLWDILGIQIPGALSRTNPGLYEPDLVWQSDNPYPLLKYRGILDTWVFTTRLDAEHPITSGLQELLLPVPGAIEIDESKSHLEVTPLVTSSNRDAGTVKSADYMMEMQALSRGDRGALERIKQLQSEGDRGSSNLVVYIEGEPVGAVAGDDDGEKPVMKVVYIADVDVMFNAFLSIRARPAALQDVTYKFENVTFLLNVVDYLADEMDYIAIRKRKLRHSTLKTVEHQVAIEQGLQTDAISKSHKLTNSKIETMEEELEKEIEAFQEEVMRLQDPASTERPDPGMVRAKLINLSSRQQENQRKVQVTRIQEERNRDKKIASIKRESESKLAALRNRYKLAAVFFPPIPPLLIAIIVFFVRRIRERQGVASARLR
ncbi:MAG TPA: ABC transporter permease [Planctomycetes bacterium]|nr:ABC transporter permease [Planctomycetaceae bacterium]HIN53048.1 ABC transporter permease [Planctomycetota bacterium]